MVGDMQLEEMRRHVGVMNKIKLRNRLIMDYIGIGLFLALIIGMVIYGLAIGESNKRECECKEENYE